MVDEKKKRPAFMTHGVRDDGTLDYTAMETYLACVLMYYFPKQFGYTVREVDGERWIEFVLDSSGYETMVRIPRSLIEQMADAIKQPLTALDESEEQNEV